MVARSVSIRLKPNSVAEFTQIVEQDILPLLREQKGFQDEITLVLPEGLQVVGISLWDSDEDANAYSRAVYPRVLKALGNVVGGPPEVHVFEVSNSTFHKIGARVAV
jgi:heme-degrading monooxygenase HmoA